MEDIVIPIIALIVVFGMPVCIVYLVSHYSDRREQRFHETLQTMMNNGQAVSEEILQGIPGYKGGSPEERNDLRTGSITSGVGIGIALLGNFGLHAPPVFGAGLLVLLIGVGILCYGIYEHMKSEKETETSQ